MTDGGYALRVADILQLEAADAQRLRLLNALFAQAFQDAGSYAAEPPSDEYLRDVLGRQHVIVLVAEIAGGEIIGGLVAYELPKLERRRSEVYIYDLAVTEGHRRQGVATRLIERLGSIARERGAWVVFVQADHGDEAAIALYQKLGVREDVLHFDLPVP
jgi:aminoglycoside 3-N-acetyltransferase I